jgi:Fe(3+) dicitrate transport protein
VGSAVAGEATTIRYMRDILIRSVIAGAILICAALTGKAQEQSNVALKVVDTNGAAVAGARLTLKSQSVRLVREAAADSEGNYFTKMAEGVYLVEAEADGFASATRELSVPTITPLVLTLKPARIAVEVSVASNSLAGTPESLSEIPGSIERIDRQTLENSRVFNFSEILRKIAGISVRDEEGFGLRPNVGIRGTNPTRSTKILFLEDGLPLSYAPYGDNASYYHPPIERYESIEVLKGSGQIAYGPQTIAGLINYLTPNPPERTSWSLAAEGGNRGFFNSGVGFGGTYRKFGTIFGFNHKRGDGAKDNTNSKLYDLSNKSVFQLNSRNVITGKFTFYREDSNVTYTGATEAEYSADPRGNVFENDFFFGRRSGVTLQHAATLTEKTSLVTSFYSNDFSRDWWRQSSNSGQRPNRLNVDPDCLSLAALSTTCGNEGRLRNYLTQGIESRLMTLFDTGSVRHEFSAGVRFHREDQERIQKNGDLPDSRDGVISENNNRKASAQSGFLQHRFVWKDLALTPGIRFERMEFKRTNRLANSGSGATGATVVTELIPGFGIAYSGLKNTTIFAGVHRGFSPPRVEDVISNSGGVIDLDSELSWNYEIGARSRLLRGIDVSAAFFRNDYQNQIVAASIAGGAAFTNGGKTLQQGLEFTGHVDSGAILRSPHNVYFRAAVTYLPIAEFKGTRLSSVTSSAILNIYCPMDRRLSATACSITDNRLPYAPKTLVTSSLGYSHPRGFDAFIENVHIARQFGDDLNAVDPIANGQIGAVPSQNYWNATVNYRIEKWKTTFFVTGKNLANRTQIVDRSRGILPSIPRLVQTGFKITF